MTMNIKKSLIFVFINAVLLCYFLDLSEKVGSDTLTLIVSLMLLNALFFAGLVIYSSVLNPVTFIFPFLFGFFYQQFHLSNAQVPLSTETVIIIFAYTFFYFIGCCIFSRKINYCKDVELSACRLNILLLIGVAVFMIELYMNGGLAIIQTIQGSNAYVDKKSIPIFHYFYMLTALYPSGYYFFYKNKKISRRFYIFVSFLCFFMIFNSLSRQLILLSIFSMFFCYVNYNKLSLDKPVVKLFLMITLLFFCVGSLRYMGLGTAEKVDELAYMKAYAQIKDGFDVNLFDITFNLYATHNFSTLNHMIDYNNDALHFGKYALQAYIKILNADVAFDFDYPSELDSYNILGTIIADMYLDFGIPGVVVLSFLYGLLVNYAYNQFRSSHSLSAALLLSTVFYVMFMSPFTNYFNQIFIVICLLFSLSFRYRFVFREKSKS